MKEPVYFGALLFYPISNYWVCVLKEPGPVDYGKIGGTGDTKMDALVDWCKRMIKQIEE